MLTKRKKPKRQPTESPRRASHHPASNGGASEVLTLAEAAAYLRVAEQDLLRMCQSGEVPGRQLGDSWRFLKPALQGWLGSVPGKNRGFLSQIGAAQDDPYRDELLRSIYEQRGRPETEPR